jgi:hypothetical protein
MTWQDFLNSDLTLEAYLAQIVREQLATTPALAALVEKHRTAPDAPPAPSADERLQQQLADVQTREALTREALLHGVRPDAVDVLQPLGLNVFRWDGTTLVPREGQTDPTDPCADLTPARWLQDLAVSHPFLFAPAGQPH